MAIHEALGTGGIAHAFGGAIALAYWTENPRGTSDIDVNVFLAAERCEEGLRSLPAEIAWDQEDREAIERDGQRRLWWDETPVDLFFDYHRIHGDAEANRRYVEFAGTEIPILGPTELAVFKAMFDRTRDWADIEEMAKNKTLDLASVEAIVAAMVGADDSRLTRLKEAAKRGSRQ